jgi:porin
VRAGIVLADEEFAGTEGGGNLINSSFGWPAFISANTLNTGPAYFVAAPGVRLAFTPSEKLTWRVGFYDGDSFDSPDGDPYLTRHGTHFRLGGEQGCFMMSELAYSPGEGLPSFKIGGWWHTADFADVYEDDFGQPFVLSGNDPRLHRNNHGFYLLVEHTLRGESGKAGHVGCFWRGGFSPKNRNTLGWATDVGVSWTGPLSSRPDDVLALGLAHVRFSPGFRHSATLADPGSPAPDFEQVVELSYTAPLTEKISLQPDLQYIRHPGGSSAQRNAVAVFLRLNASY